MKVIYELGRGGFGVVDLVENAIGERFARKTFTENQALGPDLRENVIKRFRRECRTQKGMNHRNIVPIFDDETDTDPPSYTMPVAVSSLHDDLAKDRTLGGNFVGALSDIVAALEELHAIEIFHRDLKPQNVLRFSDVSGEHPVSYYAVSDFGLISCQESQLSELTVTGMKKGSDFFTAPEITNDLRKASAQSDIYSLGCILHEMVGENPRVPCAEIKETGAYGAIMRACTRLDPSKRFRSARNFLDAVASVDVVVGAPKSQGASDIIGNLNSGDSLPDKIWSGIAEYIETSADRSDRNAIFMAFSAQRIDELCATDIDSANIIGSLFSEWAMAREFTFDYSDVIANRLSRFLEFCGLDTKVECLMALLALGTGHNRWYVERMFFDFCGPSMDPLLAKRLALEIRVRGDWVCPHIAHMEQSIRISRTSLHPALVAALAEVCP